MTQNQPLTSTTPFDVAIERLRARLRAPLPGLETFMQMAPQNPHHRRVDVARQNGCREGSVLLLLYPLRAEPFVVLTERSASLRNHAGQISLPGGRIEPGETPEQGALREAWEELGIVAEAVDVLGRLSQFYIPPSNFCLTPVVAATHRRPDFVPHDAEVAAFLEVPMVHFVGPDNRHHETRLIAGEPRRAPYYAFDGHKIWGATAMILTEMAVVWEESQRDPAPTHD